MDINSSPIRIAVCKVYRQIPIYETADGFEIIGADNQVFPFVTWDEAKAFVDAWWALQFVVSAT